MYSLVSLLKDWFELCEVVFATKLHLAVGRTDKLKFINIRETVSKCVVYPNFPNNTWIRHSRSTRSYITHNVNGVNIPSRFGYGIKAHLVCIVFEVLIQLEIQPNLQFLELDSGLEALFASAEVLLVLRDLQIRWVKTMRIQKQTKFSQCESDLEFWL